ncbi:MAG: hypothetical protein N4A71_26630 [Carboxylicivirga sp.]|nr:hypothetical protein [Carboxylicivirga sp.]
MHSKKLGLATPGGLGLWAQGIRAYRPKLFGKKDGAQKYLKHQFTERSRSD